MGVHMRRFSLISLLAVGVLAMAPGGFAETLHYTAVLDGAHETPPNETTGTGTADVSFDTDTHTLSWTVNYSGLTGPATMAHFHGPAEPGAAAGVVVKLGPDVSSPITGSGPLTDEQEGWLRKGLLYVNVHTAAHPPGEIRGQVVAAQ
jgi:hypothetical protein